jgi:hypothetical protein
MSIPSIVSEFTRGETPVAAGGDTKVEGARGEPGHPIG